MARRDKDAPKVQGTADWFEPKDGDAGSAPASGSTARAAAPRRTLLRLLDYAIEEGRRHQLTTFVQRLEEAEIALVESTAMRSNGDDQSEPSSDRLN